MADFLKPSFSPYTMPNLVVLRQRGIGIIEERRGPAFSDVAITPRNMPLPNMCYPAEFVRFRSSGTSVIKYGDSPEEIRPLSWSFKVIKTHTDRSATYDFLLRFHPNHMVLSRTVSEINGVFPR